MTSSSMKTQVGAKALMSTALPKQRTVAFRALSLLHTLGGAALPAQLMTVLGQQYQSIGRIRTSIAQLDELRMVSVDDNGVVHITEIGREHLQERGIVPVVPKYVGKMAQIRTANDFKPMTVSAFSKMMSRGPQRQGMDELRAAPSLMGGTRILPDGAESAE